jgi:uncharacterized protein (TIGR02596 family)
MLRRSCGTPSSLNLAPPVFPGAFSLIELLVVVAIFSIMVALVIPAFTQVRAAGVLTRGGQVLADQIALARQEASTKNRDIEVRIVDVTGGSPNPVYRAVQLWMRGEPATRPLGRIEQLPDGVVVSSDTSLSPLLGASPIVGGTAVFGALGSCPYQGFRIRADGTLDAGVTLSNNFLTVQSANDVTVPPSNYFTVRVNPVTSQVTIHRP